MHNWFECKVSYEKMLENGIQKKVTEPYLVDALSFTEAEARIIEEIKPYINGEFTIADIKRARLSEMFLNENGDRYYKAKVLFISLNEKTGFEKKTAVTMLVQASSINEALQGIEKGMKDTLADYEISSITETNIIDVFPYSDDNSKTVIVEFNNLTEQVEKSTLQQHEFWINFNDVNIKFEHRDIGIIAVDAQNIMGIKMGNEVFGKLLKYNKRI